MNKEQFMSLLESLNIKKITKIDFQFTTWDDDLDKEIKQIYYESDI